MKKILFVEDDPLVARIYSKKLAQEGFEVAVAEDGLAAIKQLPEFNPDLVVLDLMMPKLSGVDVLKFMRQHPKLKTTRVVVFSNSLLNNLGEQVKALGVEEIFAKAAMTPSLLIEAIPGILQRPEPPPPASRTTPVNLTADTPVSHPAERAKPAPAAVKKPVLPVTHHQNESAASFRKRIRRDFFEQLPNISRSVDQVCQDFLKATEAPERLSRLEAFNRKIRFITHMTGMAGCYRIAQLSNALEALLFELYDKPSAINESSRHTITATVALLTEWLALADQPDEQCLSPTTILVVDDDAVSSRALVFALSRANLVAKSVADPLKALEKLRGNSYDVVLMDINLPGMSGFMLCERMRTLPLHKNTPVIFITSYAEFETRARSIPGASDFITKPILPIELTVKVTAHVLKRRMAGQTAIP